MDRRSSGLEPKPLSLGFPPERQAGVPHERVGGQPGRLPTVDDCRDDVRGKVGKTQCPGGIDYGHAKIDPEKARKTWPK